MPLPDIYFLVVETALSLILAFLLVFLVPVASGHGKAILALIFFFSVSLCIILSYSDVSLYPISNAIVLSYGISGGVALSKLLKHKFAYYVIILSILAFLDLLSFLSGAQSGMPSGSVYLYLNTVYFLYGPHVIIGGGDIVFIAAVLNYFSEDGARRKELLLISVVAMILLPLVVSVPIRILYNYQDGLPLLLSVLATLILFKVLRRGSLKTLVHGLS